MCKEFSREEARNCGGAKLLTSLWEIHTGTDREREREREREVRVWGEVNLKKNRGLVMQLS